LKIRHFADGVLVQQALELFLEARQIVGQEARQHGAKLARRLHAGIRLLRLQWISRSIRLHGFDDPLAQGAHALFLGVDPSLQPLPCRALRCRGITSV
jgi:hypothetical protein